MDDRARHARLLRVVSRALESARPSARCSISSGSTSRQKTSHLSKGQRTQLALITAICAEPELLVLDEPTSGLDPIVRREFIQTVIGAYQDGEPGRRTVFVSTHLISEFEGLIDEFTIIERGRDVLTLDADVARDALSEDLRALRRRSGRARSGAVRTCCAGRAGKSKWSSTATRPT